MYIPKYVKDYEWKVGEEWGCTFAHHQDTILPHLFYDLATSAGIIAHVHFDTLARTGSSSPPFSAIEQARRWGIEELAKKGDPTAILLAAATRGAI